jgi:hypothetical protein
MLNIKQVMKDAKTDDPEFLLTLLTEKVNRGDYETYLEALTEYVEKNDIEDEQLLKIINQTLRDILHAEAQERKMFKKEHIGTNLKTFF